MKILLLGPHGQVGSQLLGALAPLGEVVAADRAAGWDLSDPPALAARVEALAPALIVNAAAYTAVDRAEAEPALAHRVNAEAPAALATAARSLGAWLVHYSTDYVFDGSGDRPWREDDPTGPLSVYGQSKLAGERAIQSRHPRHLILRTSWVHGPQGGNFIRTMLRLAGERDTLSVVDDQVGAPTAAPWIAQATAQAIGRLQQAPELAGVYHLAAAGETSWCGLARHAIAQAQARGATLRCGPDAVRAIPSAGYPTPARRPLNSRLDTQRLRQAFDIEPPSWQAGADDTVAAVLAAAGTGRG